MKFIALAVLISLTLTGCNALKAAVSPPPRYQPGAMFGDKGATPCLDACGNQKINAPKRWLRDC